MEPSNNVNKNTTPGCLRVPVQLKSSEISCISIFQFAREPEKTEKPWRLANIQADISPKEKKIVADFHFNGRSLGEHVRLSQYRFLEDEELENLIKELINRFDKPSYEPASADTIFTFFSLFKNKTRKIRDDFDLEELLKRFGISISDPSPYLPADGPANKDV